MADGVPLTGAQLLDLFDAQVTSRQLDLAGRWLRSFGEGYYTIGSAGHEGNAAVAAALRPTDPALLHYRSGAFYCVRAAQAADPEAAPGRATAPESVDGAAAGAVAGPATAADAVEGSAGADAGRATPANGAASPETVAGAAVAAGAPGGAAGRPTAAEAAAGPASADRAAPDAVTGRAVTATAVPATGRSTVATVTAPTGAGDSTGADRSGAQPLGATEGRTATAAGASDRSASDQGASDRSARDGGTGASASGADTGDSGTGTGTNIGAGENGNSENGESDGGADHRANGARSGEHGGDGDGLSGDGTGGDGSGGNHSGAENGGGADGGGRRRELGAAGGTGDPATAGREGAVESAAATPPAKRPVLQGYVEAARDVLRGMVASSREPIAGGRHKVFGRADLAVVPTTSTIASHLPRAVGMGLAVERLRRLDARRGSTQPAPALAPAPWASDAIVVCSFGDASINHASATAAFNTAGWYDHTGLRIPVLFVCEDNGFGISVRSPQGWVATALRSKPGIRYFAADGADLVGAYGVAVEAAAWVRRHRRPAVLHLTTARLMGHAGADAESAYRDAGEIAADVTRDPVVATARRLVDAGLASGAELLDRYDEIGWRVRRIAEEVLDEPKLVDPAEVIAPLAPRRPVRVALAVADAGARAAGPHAAARAEAFGGKPPELAGPLTLAQSINAALTDGLLHHPQMAVFGEDVAAKGGVYGVTKGLRDRFGAARVFDTLLDETSILGLGLGAGLAGMLPVPEIQYLAYLHNAEDQLRGEAATMGFFSQGAWRNPMVVRVAGLAYQEGFGGHFHNDNSVAVLRDVPGLVIAVPARPDDAAAMLRTCLASAAVDGSVCVFLEPIALYHTRDLYTDGDGEWLSGYAEPGAWAAGHVPVGRARVYGVGSAEDVTIITFGNGVRMSLRAASALADEGIGTRVVDLRWLAPLPVADLIREAAATGRVLVVDETRRSGGVGEGVLAALVDAGYVGSARRVAGVDSFVPLGPAARQVLVSEEAITQGARTLLAR
ncbi:transketolase C-terminal domain-containing protein [Micromonospora sp. WMMD1082]|uniref:transketolase C-terminal domain-containing protein n=1 Tax=Micromonospora sp. WMMD1082 TaxID=3016104 RepID=UPI0032422688